MSEEIAMSAYKKAKTADGKADANTASIASLAQQTMSKNIFPRHRYTGKMLGNKEKFTTLAVGDSICSGAGASAYANNWLYQLQINLYNVTKVGVYADYQVKNNGVGAQTINNVIHYLAYDISSERVKKSYAFDYPNWVIMTGRNDYKSVPKQDFEFLYRLCVRMGVKNGIDVFCCTEPPQLNMATGEVIDGTTTTENYNEYAEIIRMIAEQEGASFVDVYKEMLYRKNILGADLRDYMNDSAHPNDAGHKLIADMIAQCMNTSDTVIPFVADALESMQRKYIPQVYYTPAVLSNAVVTAVTPSVSSTSRREHTGVQDSIKISAGGYVDFEIPWISARYIIVTLLMELSTGQFEVQCPGGYLVKAATTIPSLFSAETSYLIKPTNTGTYPPKSKVRVKAVGGDVYVNNITIITPYLAAKHTKVNATQSGTWAEVLYTTDETFLSSATVGDKLTFSWFGTNVMLNIAKGPVCGKVNIKTDGVDNIIDLYSATAGYKDYFGNTEPLKLGWHTTEIIVVEKNESATENRVGVRDVKIYSVNTNDTSIIAQVGENIEVYLDLVNYNYIRSGESYAVTDNVLTAETDTVIETVLK
jgi:lysophospholipase L1-like esterase